MVDRSTLSINELKALDQAAKRKTTAKQPEQVKPDTTLKPKTELKPEKPKVESKPDPIKIDVDLKKTVVEQPSTNHSYDKNHTSSDNNNNIMSYSYYDYAKWATFSTIFPLIYGVSIVGRIFLYKAPAAADITSIQGGYVQSLVKAREVLNYQVNQGLKNTDAALSYTTNQIRETHKDLLSSLTTWKRGDIKKLAGDIIHNDITHMQKLVTDYHIPIAAATTIIVASVGAYYAYNYMTSEDNKIETNGDYHAYKGEL